MSFTRDTERAAAIGNTEALARVLQEHTERVAHERFNDDDDASWEQSLDSESYARILGQFVMDLIENEQRNATERRFNINDENEAAMGRAVNRIRGGGN